MIEIKGLSLKLGDKQIFSDYSVSIPDRGVVMISGESGIGKTTFLRILCGLQKPDSGKISGLENRKISIVFQEPRLLNHLTALENVSIVSDRDTAHQILCNLNMENELYMKAGKLSGGQKQRVSLARAYAFSDDVVLLDEPFSGLDEQNKLKAARLICSAKLAIVVSHDASDAEMLSINEIIRL